jgi:hypothetical protein
MIDQTAFVDVYSLTTKQKQRVPRAWLDDPVLGRDFRKTPSQRELDGELPPRPPGDAKGQEIAEFAEAAGIDLSGIKKNDDKLVAIEQAMGSAAVQEHVADVDPAPVASDPLAPEVAAHLDEQILTAPTPAVDDPSSHDTPAAGDKE